MTNTKTTGPIEVWLTQNNLEITCNAVRDDESTTTFGIDSLSMRGAMREITGYLISQGYQPVGRWSTEAEDHGDAVETSRKFKPTENAAELP